MDADTTAAKIQLSQNNLTELLRAILNTTKRYQSHLILKKKKQKTKNEAFGQPKYYFLINSLQHSQNLCKTLGRNI